MNQPDSPVPSDPHATHSSPPPPTGSTALSEINSEQLFQGTREIRIRHGEEIYRLRLTKNDKLILHK